MAATWKVSTLDFYKSYEGKADVVHMAHWECLDKDSETSCATNP